VGLDSGRACTKNLVLLLTNGSVVFETGFSLFNVVKNARRSSISDSNLEAFLRLASNGPTSVDLFDAGRFARLWIDAGHE
jgi:hypothetical protein